MSYKRIDGPDRSYLCLPWEVVAALAQKSAEMGYSRAGYNSAAYLVAALSQLEVEELEAVLRRNDLLPREEPHC